MLLSYDVWWDNQPLTLHFKGRERGVANQDIVVGFSPLQQPLETTGQSVVDK